MTNNQNISNLFDVMPNHDAGYWGTRWHASFWSCNFILFPFDIYSPSPPRPSWFCGSNIGKSSFQIDLVVLLYRDFVSWCIRSFSSMIRAESVTFLCGCVISRVHVSRNFLGKESLKITNRRNKLLHFLVLHWKSIMISILHWSLLIIPMLWST